MGRTRRKKPVTLAGGMQDPCVTPVTVDDPYEQGAKVIAMRALRDDPLARLRARRQIDDAQYEAGREYQQDWELAERGPQAIDPTKEAVDGGKVAEPITEAQQKAAKRLATAFDHLGIDGSCIVNDVLVDGMTMSSVAARRGWKGKSWEEYFGRRFRECLECLAVVYGFAQPRKGLDPRSKSPPNRQSRKSRD